ncbi:hypothetical protein IFM89_007426 [Coptis chinensis]|uniref:Syntaxin N-terminal domain-containing protein n=1 Tax=Coptis chinensis TaxID=261450 RepID=A0A835ICK1_9MAGN|nr:hypothetical protein IFM89_007426 [Coptis chinensis]
METPEDINVSTVGSPTKHKIMEPEEKLAIPDIHNIPVKIKRANDFYMEYAGHEEQPMLTMFPKRNETASKKIDDAKLAKDFQAALKEFQKAQRLATERETSYSVSQVLPPSSSITKDEFPRSLNGSGNWVKKRIHKRYPRSDPSRRVGCVSNKVMEIYSSRRVKKRKSTQESYDISHILCLNDVYLSCYG